MAGYPALDDCPGVHLTASACGWTSGYWSAAACGSPCAWTG